jgi:hypothetical protein
MEDGRGLATTQGWADPACEVRDNGGPGLGWDVRLLEDGELLFSRRYANEEAAQFVAECFRQDCLRAGWTA